jgi:GT2 family glycosyltransferase
LADDFDYSRTQPCEQVMGASMAIRSLVRQSVGPLDERFFIWFEEVDYCKTAIGAGWQVWYTPDVTVVHYGGVSFGQVDGLTNQRRFNKSLRQFIWKHHGPSPWLILLLLHPISMLIAWLLTKANK